MARWQPDAPGRLTVAALELFAERGFDNTTVAEIAARAGLTERTFFRHFADKREILFAGGEALEQLVVNTVLAEPESAAPLDAVAAGLEAAGEFFNPERREFARQRQAIIAANSALRERELIKLSSLSARIAESLRQRGLAEPAATLTAEIAVAVFRTAFERWTEPGSAEDFPQLVQESVDQLKGVIAVAG